MKDLLKHLVENYREKLTALSYIETFRELIRLNEQSRGFAANMENLFMESEDELGRRPPHVNGRMMEHITIDPMEEEYWNTSDDEDEASNKLAARNPLVSGPGPLSALVDYHSDEEADENGDILMKAADAEAAKEKSKETSEETSETSETSKETSESSEETSKEADVEATKEDEEGTKTPNDSDTAPAVLAPPERLSEKRRREEDDEDEMGKMMQHKRRNSQSSIQNAAGAAAILRKKKPFGGSPSSNPAGSRKIDIRLSPALQSAVGQGSSGQDSGS